MLQLGLFTLLAYTPFPIHLAIHELGYVFTCWGILLAIFAVFVAPRIQRRFGTPRTLYVNLTLLAVDPDGREPERARARSTSARPPSMLGVGVLASGHGPLTRAEQQAEAAEQAAGLPDEGPEPQIVAPGGAEIPG